MNWNIRLCAGNVREPDRGVGGVNGVGMGIEWKWDVEDRKKENYFIIFMWINQDRLSMLMHIQKKI